LNEEQGGSVIDMGFDQEEQVDTSKNFDLFNNLDQNINDY